VRSFTERDGPTSAFRIFYGDRDGIDWRRRYRIGCIGMGDVYHYGANDRFWHFPNHSFRQSASIRATGSCVGQFLTHSGHREHHSITSSARVSSEGGTVRPTAFAVLRFIDSSNLVLCWIGRSAGLAPLRILPV
jgi:hypothetical protein